MKTYNDSDSFNNDFNWLSDFLSSEYIKEMSNLIDSTKIVVFVNNINNFNETWDGEIIIDVSKLTTQEVVNYLISDSFADEISMTENKLLRLWWD